MKIEIPDGFFPPPGVPFETEKQRDLAVMLHNAGLIKVQLRLVESSWILGETLDGSATPNQYRLTPPEPRKVGPFESSFDLDVYECVDQSADGKAMAEAYRARFKRVRIHLTATAEEILP